MLSFTKIDTSLKNSHKELCQRAVLAVLKNQKYSINICYCTDDYMLEVNKNSLDHHYYTDIITFFYNTEHPLEDAELLISLDRVKDNAETNAVSFEKELARVVIHGCLHLLGFNDSTDAEKALMRTEENKYISTLFHVEQ